jgi:hypothetical protein
VFDPGLGLEVRAGFFFSRYGFNFRATGQKPQKAFRAKTNSARNIPRRVPDL